MNKNNSGQYSKARSVEDDPRFHNTWKLLKNYRDVVWSLELSVAQTRQQFEIKFGSSVDDFLDSIYLAGVDLTGTEIESQARCIERSNKMVKLLNSSVDLLRKKHKHGETYYWVLYYTYLSPQELGSVEDIIETLREHIVSISSRTYYRLRKEAIDALSSVLWGYTTKECKDILNVFFKDK